MTFGQAVRYNLAHLTDFKGRARRAEYWWYYLFMQIASLIITPILVFLIVGGALLGGTAAAASSDGAGVAGGVILMIVSYGMIFVFAIATSLLMIASTIRRLHDVGQSGHWMWLSLAGAGIVVTVMCIQEGQPYANQYGPDPKAAERLAYGTVGQPYPFPPPPPGQGAAPAVTPALPDYAAGADPFAAPPTKES